MKRIIYFLALILLTSCETYLKILESNKECPECQYAVQFYRSNERVFNSYLSALQDSIKTEIVKDTVFVDVPVETPCPDCPSCPDCPDPLPCPSCPESVPCPACEKELAHNYYNGLVMYHGFPLSEVSYDYNEKHHGQYNGVTVSNSIATFNGNSLVTIPHSQDLSLTNAITIMADILLTGNGQSAVSNIICKASNTSGNHSWALAVNSTNRLRFRLMRGTTTNDFFSTRSLPLNTWHRVIATWISGSAARIYIKNMSTGQITEQINTSSWGGTIQQNSFNVSIGGSVHSALNRHLQGQLDNVAVWSRSLSADEINMLLDFEYIWQDWTGNVPPSQTQSYDIRVGENITLEAIPNIGWSFSHWSNGDSVYSRHRILKITMPSQDISLTANYIKN